MNVFRIHIRPQGGSADMKTTFDYCSKHRVLGVGWRTVSDRNTQNWSDYRDEASLMHENIKVCEYLYREVKSGDLAWTRDCFGTYYLARVESGWEYWTTEESRRLDIDIANIFRCELLLSVEIDEVPGKVVSCFRARRTIQRIADERAAEYSRYLWNKISGKSIYPIDRDKCADIFMMLDDEETEDLVFLYLQSKGWYVLPHSRKGDSMTFEYLCVDPSNGAVAGTQVKTGDAVLNKDDYARFGHKVFLFQANGRYVGTSSAHIETLSREELVAFLRYASSWLPRSIRRKMEMARMLAVE